MLKSIFPTFILMNGKVISFIALVALFQGACGYHETQHRSFGSLDVLIDAQKKNLVHVIYSCEGTRFFNDLTNNGGLKDVKYTYYVLHHSLCGVGKAKTKIYRWFSEDDMYFFYPDEDSLLRVLLRSGPVLGEFRPFNEFSDYKKYAYSSFERGRYQSQLSEKDSLYYWLGHSLETDGFYSIEELGRNAYFGSRQPGNDTLYCFSMDSVLRVPFKIGLMAGRSFFDFAKENDSVFIALSNTKRDSIFLYHFDVRDNRIGSLIGAKNISSVPEEIRAEDHELILKHGGIEAAWLKGDYKVPYSSMVFRDFYYFGDTLRHYSIDEESVFRSLINSK